jgi:hypothetical protein
VSGNDGTLTPENGADLPVAGWYPDLTNPGHERLWTGERWIAWIRPNQVGKAEANPAGWRPDIGHPGFERLWSGEMWTEEIRRVGEAAGPAPGVTAPGVTVPGAATTMTQAVPTGPVPAGAPAAPSRGAVHHDSAPPDKLVALGNWACAAFAVLIAANVAEFIANWHYIGIENRMLHGQLPTYDHLVSAVNALRTTNTISLLADGVSAILFVIWFYRAYRNLVRAGMGDLRFAPGWAIGGWFIPIFSLFRQKQIANDIWKASEGVATVGPERRHAVPLPPALNWWWGIWIFSGLVTGIGNLTITHVKADEVISVSGLRGTRTGIWLDQIGLVAAIVALVLIIGLVRRISRKQDANFSAPTAGAPAAAWPSS